MCTCCADMKHIGLSRRGILGGMAAGLFATAVPSVARAAEERKPAMTPDQALKQLMDGHAAYLANKAGPGDYAATRAELATKGQFPIAAILSCADSRVVPELIFNRGPGGIFVLRVAGNVRYPEGIASLEYATKVLAVPLIMVMGHSACGAVAAAVAVERDHAQLPGHLPGLAEQILPAVKVAQASRPNDLLAASITENVRLNVQALAGNEPIIAPLVKAGTVKVVGTVYDLASGELTMV